MAASAVLADLSAHLEKVDQDPSTPLDTDLIEKCELLTSTPEYRDGIWQQTGPLFLQLARLLPSLQQDPSSLARFVIRLAGPYRFDDIKHVDFEAGLDLQATPFHGLILSLLEKAAATSADAQALANRPSVVLAVVRLWLCTQDTGVATQAADLLISLLRVSKNEPVSVPGDAPLHAYGAGPIWKRLFNDGDINALYYHYTSLKSLSAPVQPVLTKRDKTISQARLLEWLPRVGALDWNTIVTSHGSDSEREVGLEQGQGLLHYAALHMVDTADDILMHMTLINFFSDLITSVQSKPYLTHYDSSLSLDFLKQHGVHKQIIEFHTSDDPGMEQSFLANRTAHYISEYAVTYPENFERASEMPHIRNYLHRNIHKCDPSDLSLLASMPRTTLIPRTSAGLAWDDCVLLQVPITRTNSDALKTLSAIFKGPVKAELTYPQVETVEGDAKRSETEAILARLLTSLYFTSKPTMFSDIVRHAETIAMKDNALAALALMGALATSNWSSAPLFDLAPETDAIYNRLQNFPKTGTDLILDPSLSGSVFPTLLKPATTFSNLVGGRGDAENAAYQVAMAKFDVLKALGKRLENEGQRQDVISMVRRRISEGPWGVSGSAGSRIGTLEM